LSSSLTEIGTMKRYSKHAWNRLLAGASLLLIVFLTACGRSADIHWQHGNFKVYATDSNPADTVLGYDHHPGLLRLVESEVVAVGSTDKLVFAKRINPFTGHPEYYLVAKEASTNTHSGDVQGPIREMEFYEIRSRLQLPDFSWNKR